MFRFANRFAIARFVTGIFFPQRIALKIDGRSYSPKVLETAMFCAARDPAYKLAAETLRETAEIQISGTASAKPGGSRSAENCRPPETPKPKPTSNNRCRVCRRLPAHRSPWPVSSVDGGRTQTRLDGGPNGVQEPHWRETKNAVFMRMTGVQFDGDPHPELPACFQDRKYMKKLLSGVVDEG